MSKPGFSWCSVGLLAKERAAAWEKGTVVSQRAVVSLGVCGGQLIWRRP